MVMARERYGRGGGALGRYLERLGGILSDGEVCGPMGRAREPLGGMWGDGKVYGAMGTVRER